MVMITVGMVQVSTCTFNEEILAKMDRCPNDTSGTTYIPKAGTTIRVKKGDELGSFHYGGASHCLVFWTHIQFEFWQRAIPLESDAADGFLSPLNAFIAYVVQKGQGIQLYDF